MRGINFEIKKDRVKEWFTALCCVKIILLSPILFG
jgi:hypothetical protein